MEHFDKLAEDAVKHAIRSLVAKGKRANSGSVPLEAERMLMQNGRGRISRTDASAKVRLAIERLKARKEVKAPKERFSDWVLIDREPASSSESS